MEEFITQFKDNPAPWLIGLFLGVFYWAFYGSSRRQKRFKKTDPK